MKCPNCGKDIANDSNYCEYCGAKISKPWRNKILWIILIVLLGLFALCASSYYVYDAHKRHVKEVTEAKAAQEEAERLAENAREKARQDSIAAAITKQKQLQSEAKLQAEREKARAKRKADKMRRRNEERRRAEDARKAELKKRGLVDLGLPSGTLWKERDEEGGAYSYEDAMNRFHYNLPTKQQFEELINYCKWTWNGNGYNIVGPSGDMLILSNTYGNSTCVSTTDDNGHVLGAMSFHCNYATGVYWSSTRSSNQKAWYLNFTSKEIVTGKGELCSEHHVRLIQQK